MKKLLALVICVLLAGAAFARAQSGAYVRKQVKPNFFIPKSAEPQPEKLPMPHYQRIETNREKQDVSSPQATAPEPAQPAESIAATIPQTETQPSQAVVKDLSDTPEYQRKYQEYLRDLEYIAATGERPSNANLDNDLRQMNSNERIKVDEKFNSQRNIKAEFEETLNQSLRK